MIYAEILFAPPALALTLELAEFGYRNTVCHLSRDYFRYQDE